MGCQETERDERDRNRTQVEMQIECLNHKAVLYFHTQDLKQFKCFFEKKNQPVCRIKTTEDYMGLLSLSFSITDHIG